MKLSCKFRRKKRGKKVTVVVGETHLLVCESVYQNKKTQDHVGQHTLCLEVVEGVVGNNSENG